MAIMIAGLALGAAGSIMGQAAQGQQQEAAAAQAEMNRQMQEFETQYNIGQQRGTMGLSEMQKILGQQQGQKQSLEMMLNQKRASREQEQYASNQFSRSFRQNKARAENSMFSRGAGRGGTADAVQNMLSVDAASDSARIRQNFAAQRDGFTNQRNTYMAKLFSAPSTPKPPTYFPSTPIPMPDTSGAMAATVLSSMGSLVGGIGGVAAANQGATQGAQGGSQWDTSFMTGVPAANYNPYVSTTSASQFASPVAATPITNFSYPG